MNWQVNSKQIYLKALVAILGLLVICLTAYIFLFPFYPDIQYRLRHQAEPQTAVDLTSPILAETSGLPSEPILAETSVSSSTPAQTPVQALSLVGDEKDKFINRLVINKIGVNIPIVESLDANWALARGAWRMPQTSTPDKGSNTAIAGHRFKYLPPNNLTFYLLDKLAVGDSLIVFWAGKEYQYVVVASKIVPPTEVSVLAPTQKATLTLITCDPIWTTKNRLIVTGELVESP